MRTRSLAPAALAAMALSSAACGGDSPGTGVIDAATDADGDTSADSGSGSGDPDAGDRDADPQPDAAGSLDITDVVPDNGLASASAEVAVLGAGLSGVTTVTVAGETASCEVADDTRLDCTFPAAEAAGVVDVVAETAGALSDTLAGGFTYTAVGQDGGDDFFCALQFPLELTSDAEAQTDLVYGQIFVAGETDASDAVVSQFIAEVGYGPDASDPQEVNWTWFDTAPTEDYDFSQNNDEHQGAMTAPAEAGAYDYAYRFSTDGGLTFTYCDVEPDGSDDGYDTGTAGDWTVN